MVAGADAVREAAAADDRQDRIRLAQLVRRRRLQMNDIRRCSRHAATLEIIAWPQMVEPGWLRALLASDIPARVDVQCRRLGPTMTTDSPSGTAPTALLGCSCVAVIEVPTGEELEVRLQQVRQRLAALGLDSVRRPQAGDPGDPSLSNLPTRIPRPITPTALAAAFLLAVASGQPPLTVRIEMNGERPRAESDRG
jgi:hypothetical protein